MGLTGVHNFDRSRCFSAIQILHNNHVLKLRVLKSIPLENLPHAVEIGLRSGFGDDMLRIGSVKMFADGARGPHTAAMFQPYDDEPDNLGILLMNTEELFEYGRLVCEHGISLAIHAIGDRANHEVINAYAQLIDFEYSLPSPSQKYLRHRIEQVQVLHPDDIARIPRLEVIGSMQSIQTTSDMLMADLYWGTRSAYAYAWQCQLAHRVPLSLVLMHR